MVKNKGRLAIFILGLVLISFFSHRLFYFRQLNLAEIPTPEILDEFDFVWTGKSWFKSGIPLGWSDFEVYRQEGSFDGTEAREFLMFKENKKVTFKNRGSFDFPLTNIKEIDYGLGKRHLNLVSPYLDHPPLASWVFGLAKTGNGFEEVYPADFRKVSLSLALITGFLLFIYLFLEKGFWLGLIGFFIYQTVPSFLLFSRFALAENVIVPLSLLFLIFFRLYKKTKNDLYLVLGGLSAGLAGLAKLPGLSFGLAGLLILFEERQDRKKIKKRLSFFLIPLVVVFSFYPLYGLIIDRELFKSVLFSQSGRGFAGPLSLLKQIPYPGFKNFFIDGWWLGGWLIAFGELLKKKRKGLFEVSFLSLLLGTVFMAAADFPWYFLTAVPFLVVFLSRFVFDLMKKPFLGKIIVFLFFLWASSFHWGRHVVNLNNFANLLLFRISVILLGGVGFLERKFSHRWWFRASWSILFLVILHRLYLWNIRSITYLIANWPG